MTDHAVGEVSKGYLSHQLDGASAVKRDVNRKMLKHIHMQWMRSEGVFSLSGDDGAQSGRDGTVWIHYSDLNGYHQVGSISEEQRILPPYFTMLANSRDSYSYRREGDFEGLNGAQDAVDSTASRRGGGSLGLGRMGGMRASDSMTLEWDIVEEEVRSRERGDADDDWEGAEASVVSRPSSSKTAADSVPSRGTEGTGRVSVSDADASVRTIEFTEIEEVRVLESERRSVGSHDSTLDHLTDESDIDTAREVSAKLDQDALTEGPNIPDFSSLESSSQDRYQHINLFLGDSEEGLLIRDFFSFHDISSSTACMRRIRDLLGQYVRPSLSTDNMRCWVRDKGVAGDLRGTGILSESDSVFDLTFESTTSSSSSSTPTPMDMDDQFERTYRGATSTGPRSAFVAVPTPVPVPSPVHAEALPINPFGPIGQMLTMEKTDAVSGWRYLRDQMYDTPLSSLSAALEEGSTSDGDGRETLDVYLEMRETSNSHWSSEESLQKWRRGLKLGDILDVFVNCTAAGAVWAEGRISYVGEKSYGYGYCAIRVELLGGASQEYLAHIRGSSKNSRICEERDGKLYFAFDSSSPNLQPLYSHSTNWRSQLKEGSKLFGAVRKDAWMSATVSSVDEEDGHPGDTLTVLFGGPPSPRPSPPVESSADRGGYPADNGGRRPAPDAQEETVQIREDCISLTDSEDAKAVVADTPPIPLRLSPMLKTVNRYSDRISFFIADLPHTVHTDKEDPSEDVKQEHYEEHDDYD